MVQTYKPYWIETIDKLWSKMSFAGAGIYDVYVKLAGTESPSGTNTFLYFEPFSDLTNWTISGYSPEIQEIVSDEFHSQVASNTSGCDNLIYRSYTHETNEIIEFRQKISGSNAYGGFILYNARGTMDPVADGNGWYCQDSDPFGYYLYGTGSISSNTGTNDNDYHRYKIVKVGTGFTGYIDDISVATWSQSIADEISIGLANVGELYVSHIFARQYTDNPPLVSEPTVIDANTLKYTITTTGALTDYQIDFELPVGFLSSTTESVQVYFDETPPTISTNAEQLYTSNTSIMQYAEIVDESDLSSVTIQRNSDTPITMTKVSGSLNVYGATIPISTGYNYLQITAEDEWGNSATSSTKTVIGVAEADDRPVLTLVGTYPSTTTENSITITATIESSDFQYAKIHNSKVAGTVEMTETAPESGVYSGIISLKQGDNLIYIEAMGPTGWYGISETIVITKLNAGSTITLISDSEGLMQNYILIVSALDDEGVSSVSANYNGTDYSMTSIGNNQYSAQLMLTAYSNTISVTATDNLSATTTEAFEVTLLTYLFERTTEGYITYQRKNSITATYSGEYPATAITMKLNGITQELTSESGGYSGTMYLVPGVNVILWTITDSNGNELQIVDAVLFDTDSPVVSFKNGKGDELTFASSQKAEFIINSIVGINSVKTVYSSVQSLGQQGVTITGKNEEQLDLTASIIISTENTDRNINELVREISNVFNPNLGQGTLIYQDYNNNIYELPCYVRIPRISMNPSDRTANTRLFTAELIAPNPYFNLTPAIIETVGYKVPKWTIPFTLPIIFSEKVSSVVINNDGDSDVPIVIRYFGTATNPVLQNETSGETIKLNATINYNEYFEVSTDLLNIYAKIVNIDTGVETDAFNYLDINNMDFFKLYIGNNTISFSTDDESENAYVEIEYNKKYGLVE